MAVTRILCAFLLVLSLVLLWRLFGHEHGWASYQDMQERRDALAQQISAVEEKNIELSKEIRKLTSDREYLESVIRLEMHSLKPGEVLYIPHNDTFGRSP